VIVSSPVAEPSWLSRVGLSTTIWDQEEIKPSLPETLVLFSQVGAHFVDWAHDRQDDRLYTTAEMDRFADLLQDQALRGELLHGFETRTVHAVAEGQALDRYVSVQSNRIALCARLGGDVVVLHLPGMYWGPAGLSLKQALQRGVGLSLAEALQRSTMALDRLRPLCEKLGVRLAVENSGLIPNFERFDFYFARYPDNFLAFCLDVGHANRRGEVKSLRAYAARLSALHLHDNNEKDDDHQPPFFGTIDWRDLLRWLEEIDYHRSLNFELVYDRRLFTGGPQEFVRHGMQRIGRALGLAASVRER
jgi:sugar phosphate isomerase/epimerase